MSETEKFYCATCNAEINYGEYSTFGVCDDCYEAHHKKMKDVLTLPAPVSTIEDQARKIFDKIGRSDDGNEMRAWIEGAKYKANEIESLRSELVKNDETIAYQSRLIEGKQRAIAHYAKERDNLFEEVKQLREALKQRDEEKDKDYDYQQLKEENAILNERLAKQSPSDKWIDGISRKYGEK